MVWVGICGFNFSVNRSTVFSWMTAAHPFNPNQPACNTTRCTWDQNANDSGQTLCLHGWSHLFHTLPWQRISTPHSSHTGKEMLSSLRRKLRWSRSSWEVASTVLPSPRPPPPYQLQLGQAQEMVLLPLECFGSRRNKNPSTLNPSLQLKQDLRLFE